jgi:hypothetical protein
MIFFFFFGPPRSPFPHLNRLWNSVVWHFELTYENLKDNKSRNELHRRVIIKAIERLCMERTETMFCNHIQIDMLPTHCNCRAHHNCERGVVAWSFGREAVGHKMREQVHTHAWYLQSRPRNLHQNCEGRS